MTKVTLSSKFEMDIPKDVCQVLGLFPGQRLELTTADLKIFLTPLLITGNKPVHDSEERKPDEPPRF